MFGDKIIGPSEKYPLEARSLNAVLFVTLLIGTMLSLANLFRDVDQFAKVGVWVLAGVSGLIYGLARRMKDNRYMIIPFYIFEMVVIFFIWRYFGGFASPAILFLMAYATSTPIITKGRLRYLILGGHLATALILFFLELRFPDVPDVFGTHEEILVDALFVLISISTGLAVVVSLLILNHQQQQKKLEQLNRSKDLFFSIIAHDLRGPLGGLSQLGELIWRRHEQMDEASKRELLDVIYQASKQTYDLLDNLLQWSRVESGRLDPQPQPFRVDGLVENNISLLGEQLEVKHQTVVRDLEEGLTAYADVNMINTVLRNLISNAIKFTADGGVITVRGRKRGECTCLEVIDQGTGIEEKALKTIFLLENKYTRPGTNKETGTGLGLKLCHSFVIKNQGRITVQSAVGEGSNFRVELPGTATGVVGMN
ncbi:MAG: HAMP domain-containing sensor histidine kinase [Bacteroidales bacterium]